MFPYSTYLEFSNTPAENQDIRNTRRILRFSHFPSNVFL